MGASGVLTQLDTGGFRDPFPPLPTVVEKPVEKPVEDELSQCKFRHFDIFGVIWG
jgi:hypothetical protein